MALDLDRIRICVAEALEVQPEQLEEDTVFEELTEYDSIKMLSLMVALDDLGVIVSQGDVVDLRSLGDIQKLVRGRQGETLK